MSGPLRSIDHNGFTPDDISTLTIDEVGWKRLDGACLRWVGQPLAGDGGRDVLQLKGRGMDLAITTAYLPPGIDPGDDEAVTEALEDGWDAVLGLPALIVARHALTTAISAMEAAQGVTIEYGGDHA